MNFSHIIWLYCYTTLSIITILFLYNITLFWYYSDSVRHWFHIITTLLSHFWLVVKLTLFWYYFNFIVVRLWSYYNFILYCLYSCNITTLSSLFKPVVRLWSHIIMTLLLYNWPCMISTLFSYYCLYSCNNMPLLLFWSYCWTMFILCYYNLIIFHCLVEYLP